MPSVVAYYNISKNNCMHLKKNTFEILATVKIFFFRDEKKENLIFDNFGALYYEHFWSQRNDSMR